MPTLNRTQVKVLRTQLAAVLANAGIDGFDLEIGSARFDDATVTFQLKAKLDGAVTQEQSALALHAQMDGIDINKTTPAGEKLVEYHPRKRKYPYISVKPNGSRFKMSTNQAQMMFGK